MNKLRLIIVLIIVIVVLYIVSLKVKHDTADTVDGIETIDKTNDSIKANIKRLDSIKDAETIKVEMLDNDSTIKLFYKLIQ